MRCAGEAFLASTVEVGKTMGRGSVVIMEEASDGM